MYYVHSFYEVENGMENATGYKKNRANLVRRPSVNWGERTEISYSEIKNRKPKYVHIFSVSNNDFLFFNERN